MGIRSFQASTGSNLTALGHYCMSQCNAGSGSTSVGHYAGQFSTNLTDSVAIGKDSCRNLTSTGIEDSVHIGNLSGEGAITAGTVAIGVEAGRNNTGDNCVLLGNQQGLNNTDNNRLMIGNEQAHAIIDGTMGTTDAGQTLRLNADTIYLGSSIPTSQPGDNRLWLSNGNLSIGAVSGGGGGGLSFTPSFSKSTMYGKVDRTSIITVLQGATGMFDGQFGNQGLSGSNVAWYFNNSAAHSINEFTIWTQKSATGATSDPFRTNVCEIYGSTGTDTATPPSGNWQRLNDGATVWLAEAIATPFLIWEQYSQAYPQGFRFKCTTNMNNYNRYWIKFNFTLNPCYDIHWNYNKSHEAEYT